MGALVNLERLDRQVEIQLALDSNNQKEIEAERIYDAETGRDAGKDSRQQEAQAKLTSLSARAYLHADF
jgi:hypothetical protein